MKKLRKNTQLSLLNPKRAGRPSIHDPGIRHTRRFRLKKSSSLHLTIKVRENKADLRKSEFLRAFQIDLFRVLSPGEIYFKSINYLT